MDRLQDRLKVLRERRGLSVAEVARRVGVPVSTYREWEYGRAIRGEPYLALAQVFEVSVYELLAGSPANPGDLIEVVEKIAADVGRLREVAGKFF